MIPEVPTFSALRAGYAAKAFTPSDVARDLIARMNEWPDKAVWIARLSDADLLARATELEGRDPKNLPLYGVPFAVKDNIDCALYPTTAACPEFSYLPEADAFVVERLLKAGAILLGKTNLDQFATGLVGTRSPYGAPRCVFNSDYISGGSSSGSAIAVAAGFASFSLGTDTAGSGRVPAAFNNIVGLKPTRGALSNRGVVPACKSLDCVSIFANCVGDAMDVLEIAQGFDSEDAYSRDVPSVSLPSKIRFGVLAERDREFFGDGESARLYAEAIARIPSIGGEAVEIDYTPFAGAAALLYEGAWTAERLAAVAPFLADHAAAMDPTVRTIIEGAKRLTAVDAFNGQYRLKEAERATMTQWKKMDVLLLPTAATQYKVEAVNADPIAKNSHLGRYTNFVNLLDLAAIAVPAGFKPNGLAFGVTLIGPAGSDAALARLADRLHRSHPTGMGKFRNATLPENAL